ncbi:uncharacterized protein LOC143363861 isoform X5 [Halictus rubicundus]|uniref:uncharacterized protein LOC143363861 isoform X5 n=1 Tax=Halictus rubicundus TaxID=77578 RepID=UPI004036F278
MSSLDYLDLCRLCLVKDRVSVPIFEGEGNDLFLKIAACLPVKVAREDKLPKKICDDCVYKIELFYEFWNTTANAEKRLLQWLGEVSVEGGKQGYVSNVLNPNVMKQEQSTENRLDGGVMQQVGEHQNNMSMSMMDNMGLGIPMMISTTNQQQQQITSVPMDTSGSSVQNVQAVPGPSSQATHNQISQNQTGSTQQEVEEESSEDEENSDDECDVDEEYFAHTVGLPVKEESEEDPNSRTIEPTTFVNVSLACDEAGPSGLQQQKITDLPEMSIPQPADGDPKTGMSADATENPAQPLFIVCSGVPDMDQDDRSKTSTNSESNDTGGPECVQLDGNETDWCNESDVNDNLDSDEPTKYGTNLAYDEQSSKEDTNDPLLNGVTDDSADERFGVQLKSVLVPVRDPVTKKIKHELVPIEIKDETGLNIIKSVLIPVEDQYGAACYEVKKVFVPIRPELTLPQTALGKSKDGDRQSKEENGKDKSVKEEDKILNVQQMCQFCQKVYDTQQALNKHIRRFHERPYQCDHCHHAYVSKAAYKEHMKTHAIDTYVECPFCQQRYKRMFGLRQHQIRVHSNVEPKFICDHCGKRFKLKSDLALHIDRIHMNVGHPCKFCGKFVRNVMLHEWQHESGLKKRVVKYFKCHLCTNKFRLRNGLENHLLMHKKGFECDKCKCVFAKPSTLATHKYTKHKPDMLCTICNRSFKYRHSFHRHVLAHAGSRPYKCDICNEDFEKRTCYVKHRKTHPEPLPDTTNSTIAAMARRILQNH